jgi:hypothetical protein
MKLGTWATMDFPVQGFPAWSSLISFHNLTIEWYLSYFWQDTFAFLKPFRPIQHTFVPNIDLPH